MIWQMDVLQNDFFPEISFNSTYITHKKKLLREIFLFIIVIPEDFKLIYLNCKCDFAN